MTNEKFYEALGDINEDHVKEAEEYRKGKKPVRQKSARQKPAWRKWGSLAACIAVVLIAAAVVRPMLIDHASVTPPVTGELKYESRYVYHVDGGAFSAYVGGKVIAEDKIGDKLEDVSVIGGWKNSYDEWVYTETLRGEIYAVADISADVAVALKFIDQGEAVTTTHYYVIMNPNADLSSVAEYIIVPDVPNNPGDEMAGEIPE
jgi:hypothetical protein